MTVTKRIEEAAKKAAAASAGQARLSGRGLASSARALARACSNALSAPAGLSSVRTMTTFAPSRGPWPSVGLSLEGAP